MVSAKKTKGFTLIELLVVVAIIALLVGIMVPAVQNALDKAKDTVVRTELKSIELGLNLFKSDFGAYPSSDDAIKPGAQLLSDVIAGVDLRGYEDPDTGVRKDPHIEVGDIEFVVFDPDGDDDDDLDDDGNESNVIKCKWNEPILYYAAIEGARPTWQISDIEAATTGERGIYDANDNDNLFSDYDAVDHSADTLADDTTDDVTHPIDGDTYNCEYKEFYQYILNPDVPSDSVTGPCPYKVDSFILISAGKDGEYGTDDDVTNFK